MSRARLALIAFLILAPSLSLMGVGSYFLYRQGWSFWVWWPMTASMVTGYFLAWRWTRKATTNLLPRTATVEPPGYWTDRDQKAWQLIESRTATLDAITPKDLENPHRFTDEALTLGLQIARIYHPNASDPFGHLTIPEILTCSELLAHDLTEKVKNYIPLSHMVTVKQWQQARTAVDWGQKAWNISWLARAFVNPIQTATQYAVSQASGSVLTRVQNNVLLWFYTAYIHELGRYLIELNSGRLKVGTQRYLELMAAKQAPPILETETVPTPGAASQTPVTNPTPPTTANEGMTVALSTMVIGQVKAGKSSLVNALLGESKAATDVTPLTAGAVRYQLRQPNLPAMTLVDTAGYGVGGPKEEEFAFAVQQAESADLLLLVVHGRNAARKTDHELLVRLQKAFALKPALKLPPIVVVMTHVDLLTPAMEWSPPYDWQHGTRPKEIAMREAVAAVAEDLGSQAKGIVPVCVAEGKLFNIREELMPAMAKQMSHAHGSALLRLFHLEGTADQGKKAIDQVLNVGRQAIKILWDSAKKS